MDISQLSSAKKLKINLKYSDINSNVCFQEKTLLEIRPQEALTFFVKQYGQGVTDSNEVRCTATKDTADYLLKLFDSKKHEAYYPVFLIDEIKKNENELVVQTFIFSHMKKYNTAINVIVSNKMLKRLLNIESDLNPDSVSERKLINQQLQKLKNDYVWEELGQLAIFYLNNNKRGDRKSDLCLLGNKKYLNCQNNQIGLFAENEIYKTNNGYGVDIAIAPSIEFISQLDASTIDNEFSHDISKLSASASYMERWDAYNELTKKELEEDKEEFGALEYTSREISYNYSGTQYTFTISDSHNDQLDKSDIGKPLLITKIKATFGENPQIGLPKGIPVGSIQKISGNKVITLLETEESELPIPKSGFLELDTIGDEMIMKRREMARDRIMDESRVPMPNLLNIIESDTPKDDSLDWGKNPPITDELKKKFKKAENLTEHQKQAIDIAINTPDVCFIQGPPGTGKTTTIQAIDERFREVFAKEEREKQRKDKDYNPSNPRVLISSFQNEAVDNAISATLPKDLPAYRKKAKSAKDTDTYQDICEKWKENYSSKIKKTINLDIIEKFLPKKQELEDDFDSYRSSRDPQKAKKLIEDYLSFDVDVKYPELLVTQARELKKSLSIKIAKNDTDPELEYFVKKIQSLRTAVESFNDDGKQQLNRFLRFIELADRELSKDILEAFESVLDENFSAIENSKKFKAYTSAVNTLRKSVKKDKEENKDDPVAQCIRELAEHFETYYINTFAPEDKAQIFLGEFWLNLQDDYEDCIRTYATRTGATCQACLDLRDKNALPYDLVIIDEAARANPMDLFIPMSLAKKIIMVGDQKQLPHMLEYDVIQQLAEDPRFKDIIPEIEITLFERLFNKYSKSPRIKSILLTEQFRMHPDICNFVSKCFYDNQLKTASTMDLEKCSSPKEINEGKALTFVNIPLEKGAETPGKSKSRKVEVDAIIDGIQEIFNHDPKATIGVITFYSAQETLINNALEELMLESEQRNNIQVGTVDAFQGKEFNYVLLSCVRSNPKKTVGFLEKPNRLCVAFSRAQKQLIVYGDAETLKQIPCFNELYTICKNGGGCLREL